MGSWHHSTMVCEGLRSVMNRRAPCVHQMKSVSRGVHVQNISIVQERKKVAATSRFLALKENSHSVVVIVCHIVSFFRECPWTQYAIFCFWIHCIEHCLCIDSIDWAVFTTGPCAWMCFAFWLSNSSLRFIIHVQFVRNSAPTNKISAPLLTWASAKTRATSRRSGSAWWFDHQASVCDIWEVNDSGVKPRDKYSVLLSYRDYSFLLYRESDPL